MVVVMTLILRSVMKSYEAAFFLSVMLLPGILFVKYFAKDLSFSNRRQGVLNTVYFLTAALLIEFLAIILVHWALYDFNVPQNPEILLNPFFIWFMLASLLSIEKLLEMKFIPPGPEEKYIEFTSERKKISIGIDTITYIESNDYEVFVRTVSGEQYPTRMKISQWEAVLDSRFLRIHRAYIVNRQHISRFDSRTVWLGNIPLEISRKYRESVWEKLGKG